MFLLRLFVSLPFLVIQFIVCASQENLSNPSSGVQTPRDICTRSGRYLYSTNCGWITNKLNFLFGVGHFFQVEESRQRQTSGQIVVVNWKKARQSILLEIAGTKQKSNAGCALLKLKKYKFLTGRD